MVKKSFSILFVFALCFFQFSSIAQAQFLSPVEEEMDLGETEFTISTPEEIQAAVSESTVKILQAMAYFANFLASASASNPETQANEESSEEKIENPLFDGLANLLNDNGQAVGDAFGTLVADALVAFNEAQETGEDAGAAVGNILADALRKLNNDAGAIGETVQQELDAALGALEEVPVNYSEEDVLIIGSLGQAVTQYINAFASRADAIGDIVAKAVNDAVNLGGSTVDQLGNVFVNLEQAMKDNADEIGYIYQETMSGLEGVSDEQIIQGRDSLVKSLKTDSISSTKSFTEAIIVATVGASSTAEAINMFGGFVADYYIAIADFLSKQ